MIEAKKFSSRSIWLLSASLAVVGCSTDGNEDTGGGNPDMGMTTPDMGDVTPDMGTTPDTGTAPDMGTPPGEWMLGDILPEGTAPARRGDMAAAFDPETNRIIMFYGDSSEPENCGFSGSRFLDDGYVFDIASNRWYSMPVTSGEAPISRARSRGLWDPMRKRFILFGGRWRAGTMGDYTFLNDVWAFDPTTGAWTELSAQTTAAGAPEGRMNFGINMDADGDRFILHGGGTTDFFEFFINSDTWAFNFSSNQWEQIAMAGTQPNPRIFHSFAFDSVRRRLFVFSGGGRDAFTSPMFFGDMWMLDLMNDSWTQIRGTMPAGRIKGEMIFDEGRDRLLLFGGHDDTSLGNNNDLWSFDLNMLTWTEEAVGDTFNAPNIAFCEFPGNFANVDINTPERRESHLFLRAGADTVVMYGGRTDCGLANDTWTLNLTDLSWNQLNASPTGMTCVRNGNPNCDDAAARMCD